MKNDAIDYAPLSQQVTASDVHKVMNMPKSWTWLGLHPGWSVGLTATLGVVVLFNFFTNFFPTGIEVFIFIFTALLATMTAWAIPTVNTTKIHIRIDRFAGANGFRYAPKERNPWHQGIIFDEGDTREIKRKISGTMGGSDFSMGNYSYYTGSGKSRRKHDYGYVVITLPRRLPHMVLDAKGNNFWKFSNLPDMFTGGQKLQLEGDFNKYFDLYCPKQYERDALYVFTPDVMSLLIDHGQHYDIEIIDDQLFVYSSTPFVMTSETQLQTLFRLISVIGSKMEQRTDYYADERVVDRSMNIVAEPGRRLKKSMIPAIITAVFFIVYIFSEFILRFLLSDF